MRYVLDKEILTSVYVRYEFINESGEMLCFEQRALARSDYYIDSESGYSKIEDIKEYEIYYRFTGKNHHYALSDGKYSMKIKSSTKLSNEDIILMLDGLATK